ncbi:DUF1638 domain-containing protein [Pseudoruegeria sp. HB172150]|uniref:DUF1638 domain-containing protein n=1 Tax=Pseudoruegeria sp. HB172150 TaxID=2721164 RepID=UPI0015546239|nr:DUF1638 domain-containing protein [Pseudoruegeria sp. HB172150]
MQAPDDSTLTESGLAPSHRGRVLLLACGALAREILDLIEANGWTHLDLMCLPAILHNRPDRIPDAIRQAVARHRAEYETIHVVYADCGTGGQLARTCKELGLDLVEGPHCYSFFEGNKRFLDRAEDEISAFYLTDFLVRQFDAFVWKPLGLDRHPDLRDMYFGNYTKLVYQAQTDDPVLDARAQDCANRLGLAYERRLTGYGDLATTLESWAKP